MVIKKFQTDNNLTPDGVIGKQTLSKLKELYPRVLDTPFKMAHFLGQCDHESMGFTKLEENLKYSKNSLRRVLGTKFDFPTIDKARLSVITTANLLYNGRMGNRLNTNDGYDFRGRSIIQLTGRENYKTFSKYVNEDLTKNPDLVATKYYITAAIWYFDTRVFNNPTVIPNSISVFEIKKITKLINGGLNGIEDRIKKTIYYYNLIIENKIY